MLINIIIATPRRLTPLLVVVVALALGEVVVFAPGPVGELVDVAVALGLRKHCAWALMILSQMRLLGSGFAQETGQLVASFEIDALFLSRKK